LNRRTSAIERGRRVGFAQQDASGAASTQGARDLPRRTARGACDLRRGGVRSGARRRTSAALDSADIRRSAAVHRVRAGRRDG
jgi:hypothetical protein